MSLFMYAWGRDDERERIKKILLKMVYDHPEKTLQAIVDSIGVFAESL